MPFAEFLMSSDDWKTVLLALIATGGAAFLECLRQQIGKTKTLINGRMDELLKNAKESSYAQGHADGKASVMTAVANSEKVSLDAQGIAEAVASTPANPNQGK